MTDSDSPAVPAQSAPATPDPSAQVVPAEEALPVRRRRGVGTAALILALLAVIGDIVTVVFAVITFGAVGGDGDLGIGAAFLNVGAAAILTLIGGAVLALIALVLGLIALVTGRGRVPGAIGLILALGVLILRALVVIPIIAAGASLAG